MKPLRFLLLVSVLPSCSLLYDGSGYRGGSVGDVGPSDVGASDTPLPDGSMPGMCTAARITECTTSSQFCDPATGNCVASCTNTICAALDPGRPICSGTACVACGEDADCGVNGVCESAVCMDCDGDDDGFPRAGGGCDRARPVLPRDCNDARADVHPGAVPICDDGIDQSCSGGEIAGGLATEFGRYAPISISFPPGTDLPSRLRVFMVGPARALAIFSAGDANQTVVVADVNFESGTATSQELLRDILVIDDRRTVQMDALRLEDGNIVVSMLSTDSAAAQIRRAEYDVVSDTWSETTSSVPFGGADTMGFNQFGDAALVRREDGQEYVVTAARTNASTMLQLFALRVGSPEVYIIAPSSALTVTRPWIESAGNAAVFAAPGGEIRFWNGEALAGDRSRVIGTFSGTGNATTAAVASVRGVDDGARIAVFAPSLTAIDAFTADCSTSTPFASCPTFVPGMGSPAMYPLANVASPAIAATLVSQTALIVATTRAGADGPEIGFVVAETGPLATSLLTLPVGIPVEGTARDLALDANFTQDGSDMMGVMELGSLYLEEDGLRRSVYLVGARGCIGYEDF